MKTSTQYYRPDIDGLRAAAVLAVLGFHAFPGMVPGGFAGVDIFFVISGFLISGIIFGGLETGSFSFAGFYARRIRRIFPALLLVLVACHVFGWFALLADEYKQLGRHIAGGAGFVSNILLWNESGYFDNAAETKPLLHLWSLGIEEQFYIVWPLLAFARIVESGTPTLPVRVGAVLAAVVLAWLTYRFVERPIRSTPRGALKVAALCICMTLVGSVGYYTYLRDGFGFRLKEFEARVRNVKRVVESTDACKAAIPLTSRYCLLADPGRAPTVAIVGDSHGNRLFSGLSKRYADAGENLLQIGVGGCLPFWNIEAGRVGEPNRCPEQMHGQLEYVLASSTIKTVILANRGPMYTEGTNLAVPGRYFIRNVQRPADEDGMPVYRDALLDAVKRFTAADKRVILIVDAPEFSYDPLACIDLNRPWSSPFKQRPDCRIRRDDVEKRNRRYVAATLSAAQLSARVKVVNLQDALCDENFCHARMDGKLLYMDPDHLNEHGSEYVAGKLWPLLAGK